MKGREQQLEQSLHHLITDYFTQDTTEYKSDIYNTQNISTFFPNESKPTDSVNSLSILLSHITKSELRQAERIIKIHPELLFETGDTTDLLGNTFVNYSPVQLARYLHNTNILKMMKIYLNQVTNGQERFATILKEADEERNNQQPYNFKKLINSFNFYDHKEVSHEMALFQEHFKPREIKNEKSYNIKNLFEAYAIYISISTSSTWEDKWDDEQQNFFLHNVIDYLQSSLPFCYGQAHRQGLYEASLKKDSINMVQNDWHDLSFLYQTKMTALHKLMQELNPEDQAQNTCAKCSLM